MRMLMKLKKNINRQIGQYKERNFLKIFRNY